MDLSLRPRHSAHFRGHFVQPVLLGYGVDRIEAQTVEAILHQPVQCVFDKKTADLIAAEIDRAAPWCCDVRAKHFGRVHMQIISVGSKMVVDDIQENHQVTIVSSVTRSLPFPRGMFWRRARARGSAPAPTST